jgi:Putative DNA-binding domain
MPKSISAEPARFAQQVLSRGMAAIHEIVAEREEETLHLEFKTLSAASSSNLAKDDRKVLAKAICGLANAEGGTLIVGLETQKEHGLDVASARKPVPNYTRLRNRIAAAVPEMLSPQHPWISVEAIVDDTDPSAGYLIIDVRPSDRRPHMSLKEHQYFRRGSDGTRLLEHGEIRDLMFAAREGAMDIECHLRDGGSVPDLRFMLSLILTLKNVGGVPVRAPYLRIIHNQGWRVLMSNGLRPRTLLDGSFGVYSGRDFIVHLDDEISLAELLTGLDFRRTGLYEIREAVSTIIKREEWNSFMMLPFSEMPQQAHAANDRPVAVAGIFGAENVAVKAFNFNIDKRVLLDMFRKMKGL